MWHRLGPHSVGQPSEDREASASLLWVSQSGGPDRACPLGGRGIPISEGGPQESCPFGKWEVSLSSAQGHENLGQAQPRLAGFPAVGRGSRRPEQGCPVLSREEAEAPAMAGDKHEHSTSHFTSATHGDRPLSRSQQPVRKYRYYPRGLEEHERPGQRQHQHGPRRGRPSDSAKESPGDGVPEGTVPMVPMAPGL